VTPITPSSPPPADRRPALVDRPDPADLYAALDLGTNSCRMLIAQPKGNQLHVVDSFSKSVQLGQGLEASGGSAGVDGARGGRAQDLPEEAAEAPGGADAPCRDGGLPPRHQRRRVHRPGETRHRAGAGDHRTRGGGAARRRLLRAARLDPDRAASGRRYRRRLDRACLDRPQPRAAPRRPKAIMRLHQGFDHEETPFPRAKVVDWISIPLGVATLKDMYATWPTMARVSR
jgi:exopolyphosphatase/guanosine-5'-triphosphate,3'-diphosphate pyrophosphatase